jgi:AbrB family looped-hinge helix DNA binding protein
MATRIVTVDAKGRLSIPIELRDELGIEPGDILFVEREDGRDVLRYAKATNPFDLLAEAAEVEYRAGKTKNIRVIAEEMGIQLDNE